jgi:RNA polymerase sigma-70 factor (ECF subfamily)
MRRSAVLETDDRSLIASAAGGDKDAFGELYERHAPRVSRHAYFLTGDAVLAEDITAQVFLKAFEAIDRYQERGLPFTAWLLRIACNLVINHKKSHKNDGHAQLPETIETDDRGHSPEISCETKLDGERVWREVKKLPNDQRQVIIMRFIDDMGYPDIAGILGKSVGAVRVIQFRALANLRHMMEQDPLALPTLVLNGNGHYKNGNGNGHAKNGNGSNGNGFAMNGNGRLRQPITAKR